MRRNNFDVLRLFFAAMVIFSHSFALLGLPEPIAWDRTLGNLGVHGFFVISGYLITQSYGRSGSLRHYGANRVLRIVPGLVVALVVSTILASLLHHFPNNPVPAISDGPVWTLTWEAICYAAVAALGVVGALSRTSFPAVFAVAWILYLANISTGSDFFLAIVPLFLMFAAGALFALFLTRIPIEVLVLAVLGLALSLDAKVFLIVDDFVGAHIPFLYGSDVTPEEVLRVLYTVSFPVVVIWLGKLVHPSIRIRNDVSYGVYIYGWPVAQVLIFLSIKWTIPVNPWLLFVMTMVVTLPVAYLSWRFVEKPALNLKRRWRRETGPTEPSKRAAIPGPAAPGEAKAEVSRNNF